MKKTEMTEHTTQPLDAAALDRIARNYFAEEYAQQHVKNAIHDAFLEAGLIAQARSALPAQPSLTAERIAEIYRAEFNNAPGAARQAPQNVPPLVIEFGNAIEREIRAAQAHHAAATTVEDARDSALEQAAREVEKRFIGYRDDDADLREIALSIRSLKSAPNSIQNNEGNTNV